MKDLVANFWKELKKGCDLTPVNFEKIRRKIELSLGKTDEMDAYYISVLPPNPLGQKIALDIVIVSYSVAHMFTFFVNQAQEHYMFMLRAFIRIEEIEEEETVTLQFYFAGERGPSFVLADSKQNQSKLLKFARDFSNIAGETT